MTPFLILFVITLVNSEGTDNSTTCDNFQANFNLTDVLGSWHMVAIIPTKLFYDKHMKCCKVDISEADGGSVRWLINKTVESPNKLLEKDTNGIIVRQRYHTDNPFDVWSKSVQGVNGCFQLVISWDIKTNDIASTLISNDPMMQLHVLEVKGSEPFLVQMLWRRMIAVVIYRRKPGVTQDELKPVFELVNKLRGPQRLPEICESPLPAF